MSGIALAELLEPVRDLLNADIFTDADDHLAFGHDLIREGARSSSPSAVRRGFDRRRHELSRCILDQSRG